MYLAAVAQEELNVGLLLQQLLHHGQQAYAFIAQGQTPTTPVEQLDAVLPFEAADLRGDRGLAEAELFFAAWVMLPRRATMWKDFSSAKDIMYTALGTDHP
nr:hypothetical protein GCM10020185_32680 [Pseudomonas brassicacearum subsp. brassicacearum]